MFRWVNKIIEFIGVAVQLDEIGINEIESKMTKLKEFQTQTQNLLNLQRQKAPFKMFKDLRESEELTRQLAEVDESYYSTSNFDSYSERSESVRGATAATHEMAAEIGTEICTEIEATSEEQKLSS